MRESLFIISFIFLTFPSFPQRTVDSLNRALRQAEGTQRVDILNQLTYEYINVDNRLADARNKEAMELSDKIGYTAGSARALVYRGVYEYLRGENELGISFLKRGREAAARLQDQYLIAYTCLQMGNSYMNLTRLDSAQSSFEQAHVILSDSTDPVTLSKLYKNMATLYGLKSLFDLQVTYLNRCLVLRQLLNDPQLVADALVEIGRLNASNSHNELAKHYLDRADSVLRLNPSDEENLNDYRYARALLLLYDARFDEAYPLLDSARTFYERTSMIMKMVSLHIDLGTVFMSRGEYEVALKNLYTALRFATSKDFLIQVMDIHAKMGWVNYYLGEYEQALSLGSQSLLQAERNGIIDRMANAYALLGVVNTQLGKFMEANRLLNESLSIRLQSKDLTRVSEAYANLGWLKEKEKEYATSAGYYSLSMEYASKTDYSMGLAISAVGLGKLALLQNSYAEAANFFDQGEVHVQKIQANEVRIDIYQARRDLFARQGLYKQSLYYSMLADQWKDSLHRRDLARRFTNLQKMEEIEKRDRDIELLGLQHRQAQEKINLQQKSINQQYLLIAVAALALALLSVIAIVYARFYFKIKRLHALIEERNKSIQGQADELINANAKLGSLYREVMEQKEEIQAQAEELTENNDHIRSMNDNLQVLVEEKARDLLKTNRELIKQNDELLQFSYTVSHNLRGPVARLLGLSALLQNTTDNDERNQFNQLIYKTSQDLDGVIRDLNKIIDVRNELHQVKEQVYLDQEWSRCCDLVRELIPLQSRISTSFEGNEVFTIRAMVHSIFYNLLSNAIKYRSPKRSLKVDLITRVDKLGMWIVFQDNGLGIDMSQHENSIFKLFKRFHTHVEGRGLGLYLIKSQIESLNGTIHVSSKLDEGTRFEIFIPEVTGV